MSWKIPSQWKTLFTSRRWAYGLSPMEENQMKRLINMIAYTRFLSYQKADGFTIKECSE